MGFWSIHNDKNLFQDLKRVLWIPAFCILLSIEYTQNCSAVLLHFYLTDVKEFIATQLCPQLGGNRNYIFCRSWKIRNAPFFLKKITVRFYWDSLNEVFSIRVITFGIRHNKKEYHARFAVLPSFHKKSTIGREFKCTYSKLKLSKVRNK